MIYVLFILNLVNSYVIFDFMDRLYSRKYDSKRLYILSYIIFTGLHLFVNSFQIVEVNMVYEVVCVSALGSILYKKFPKKAIYNISFVLYLIFMDLISFPLYSTSLIREFRLLFNDVEYMMMTGIVNYILVICTYRFIIKYFFQRNINAISIRQDIFFIVLAVTEIAAIAYIWKVALEYSNVVLLFVSLSFIFLDLYILYLLEFVAKHTKLEYQVNLSEQQALMLNRNIHDLELKYHKSQKIVHEVRSYLNMLEKLNMNDEKVLANRYADQLHEKLNQLEYRFQVENPIMRILINDSLLIAEEKEIEFKLKVKEIDWRDFAEIDLTTLFANLFNNAIEACEQMTMKKRWIDFRLGQSNHHVVISLSNSYNQACLREEDDKFLSTKIGHSGIGLSNIGHVVEKYNGNFLIDVNEERFTIKIIIPLRE